MRAPENPAYTRYHPRWHRRRMPIFWWLRKPAYAAFILRELTSLAVGYAALLLLAQAWFLARGPEAYVAFQRWLEHPAALSLHGVVLLGLLFHTVTWLSLAPKTLHLRLGSWRVPTGLVLGVHYLAWALVSAVVVWLLLWRGG